MAPNNLRAGSRVEMPKVLASEDYTFLMQIYDLHIVIIILQLIN